MNMEIKTEAGPAKPMPLSEAQRYNAAIRVVKWFISIFGIPVILWTIMGLYIFWKIFSTGIVNTWLARCVC